MGVPTLGCACPVCTSSDQRDKRLRPSVLLRWQQNGQDRSISIDTGPDFRIQGLRAGISRIDAVLYTHAHADHILGLDDLRPLSYAIGREGAHIRLLATQETASVLERVYDYTLSPDATYKHRARVQLEPLPDQFELFGASFTRVPLLHGNLEVSGFRFGRTAYLTDVSEIPESSFALLEGLDCLILSALRHAPHPNHATVAQAVEWAKRIGARQTWFTHISHELGHEQTNQTLPSGMALAYDELSFPVVLQ